MKSRSRSFSWVAVATLLGMASVCPASSLHRGADVQGFRNYRLGPGLRSSPPRTGCLVHDVTRDGRVDLADAAVFQRYFNQSGTDDLRPLSRSGNYAHDWDGDREVFLDDYAWFNACWPGPLDPPADPACLAVFDFDNAGRSDGLIDIKDFAGLDDCFSGEGVAPPDDCFRPGPGGAAPTSGMFALHGQPVDVLADPDGPSGPQTALALQYSRARYFDLKHGRWLQWDPSGYTDGNNLYEAFGGNPVANTDPTGRETYAEAKRRRTQMEGADVWAVDYWVVDTGANLGLGAQLYLAWNGLFGSVPNEEIAERTYAGTEYFAYTSDPRLERRMDVLVENQRWLVEEGYIANRDVANLHQGIIVLGTSAVALPVATVVAPVAAGVTGTSVAGTAAAGAFTGGFSAGTGTAAAHMIVGDSPGQVLDATLKGTASGLVFGGVFGGVSRFDIHLTGANAGQWVYGSPFPSATTPMRVTQFYDPARGNFGPGAAQTLATPPTRGFGRIFDGPWFGPNRPLTWVSPLPAARQTMFTRAMTGRLMYRHYVEFDVHPSELGRALGVKSVVPGLTGYQRIMIGPVDLGGRNPVFGTLDYLGTPAFNPGVLGGSAGVLGVIHEER